MTVEPSGHLDGAERRQPRDLRVHIVGLDVEVIARGIGHRLHSNNQISEYPGQHRELLLTGDGLRGYS